MERWFGNAGWNVPRQVDVSRGLTGAYISLFSILSHSRFLHTPIFLSTFVFATHLHFSVGKSLLLLSDMRPGMRTSREWSGEEPGPHRPANFALDFGKLPECINSRKLRQGLCAADPCRYPFILDLGGNPDKEG